MAALLFDTCCGCIELRTGCLIIGYLNLVYSILSVLSMLVIGVVAGAAVASDKESIREQLANNPDGQAAAAALSVVVIILVVIVLLFLIMNIVFVVGLHQNKRGHVKAYMIFHVIFLVLYLIMFLAGFANSPINWGNVVQMLLTLLLSTYFLMVIRSYYYRMNDASRQPAIYNTA